MAKLIPLIVVLIVAAYIFTKFLPKKKQQGLKSWTKGYPFDIVIPTPGIMSTVMSYDTRGYIVLDTPPQTNTLKVYYSSGKNQFEVDFLLTGKYYNQDDRLFMCELRDANTFIPVEFLGCRAESV